MTAKICTPQGSEHDAEAEHESHPAEGPTYERVDLDRYVVLHDGRPVGYIEVVPPVMVCYSGHPYTQAFEVAQVHDFHRAVSVVAAYADSRRRPMITA